MGASDLIKALQTPCKEGAVHIWGIGVGWLMLRLRRWVREPRVEITLSVLTPFLAYWPPEHLGGSGVLATLHQLERPSPDQRRHQAARNFLLELLSLPGRRAGVPRHRPAGAHADGPHRTLSGVR